MPLSHVSVWANHDRGMRCPQLCGVYRAVSWRDEMGMECIRTAFNWR